MADSGVRNHVVIFAVASFFLFFLGIVALFGGNAFLAVLLWSVVVIAVTLFVVSNRESSGTPDSIVHESNEPRTSPTRTDAGTTATDSTDDALSTFRRRYAAGEVSEAQFERGVERLLTVESDRDEAVVALRNRYARGELTDEQFDRKFERLYATSTVENAEESVERGELAFENG
ncbi:SHOCT domain-containing protein (plasmid) [Haladaptatus sp. SPP-AMP-3]|uniref:SHOCT domain-containing protein n=1 Tax=Haladaptatus sp. SPP-AMP-3 TaxID=3121295 RepID=UPI003C2EFB98